MGSRSGSSCTAVASRRCCSSRQHPSRMDGRGRSLHRSPVVSRLSERATHRAADLTSARARHRATPAGAASAGGLDRRVASRAPLSSATREHLSDTHLHRRRGARRVGFTGRLHPQVPPTLPTRSPHIGRKPLTAAPSASYRRGHAVDRARVGALDAVDIPREHQNGSRHARARRW